MRSVRRYWFLLLLGLVGCASAKPAGNESAEAAPAASTEDPYKRAESAPEQTNFKDGRSCEAWARTLLPDEERAFGALASCVNKSGLILIKPFTQEPWASLLGRRADAAKVLAAVIAARGGDVSGDLGTVNKRGVRVLSFEAATDSPERSVGHWVLLTAKISRVQAGPTGANAELDEVSVSASTVKGVTTTYGNSYDYRNGTSQTTAYNRFESNSNRDLSAVLLPTGRKLNLVLAGLENVAKKRLQEGDVVVIAGRFKMPKNIANPEDGSTDLRYFLDDVHAWRPAPAGTVILED